MKVDTPEFWGIPPCAGTIQETTKLKSRVPESAVSNTNFAILQKVFVEGKSVYRIYKILSVISWKCQ